jgi:AraC-like DNA-binding protein
VNLRGFSRRILEFPIRYASLAAVGEAFGISTGALKARFRRRGLPSPSHYLRWFRLLAAARVLSDPRETTLSASYRLGFESDGNFCRWIRANSGMTPSSLRDWNGRLLLLVRLAESCLPNGALDAWESFGELFLREVA